MDSVSRVILTSDRSLETTYRNNNFVGYLSSLPLGPIPKFLYNKFYPMPSYNEENEMKKPHLSIRTIESIIKKSNNNLPVKIVHPDRLNEVIRDNDLILLSSMDPLGIGPATSSWQFINYGTPYHVYYFWKLIKLLQKLKKARSFKIMVGGAGAWQIKDEAFLRKQQIDYLFSGEAEKILPYTIEKIKNNDTKNMIFNGEMASPADILPLLGPTNLSMIEISRGCGRMCGFCAPTRSGKMRSIPFETIKKTALNFKKHGLYTLNIQSEDTLRYDSKGFNINEDSIWNLYNSLFKSGIKRIFMTHATLANIADNPDFIFKLSKLLKEHGHKYYGFQPGIETGSDRIMRKLMPGKYLPLNDMEWSEIVKDAFKICHKSKWIPTASLILGIPGENYEDLQETKTLIEFLIEKEYLFIFAPLMFVPVPSTPLGGNTRPKLSKANKLQKELFRKMWKFNLKNIFKIWNVYNVAGYEFEKWKSNILIKFSSLLSKIL